MSYDPAVAAHQEWIGYVKPIGVVVSIPALIEAGVAINRASIPLHRDFLSVLPQTPLGEPEPRLLDFQRFAVEVLNWRSSDLAGPDESLTIPVPGYDELLHPDYVVKDGDVPLLLISKTTASFDDTLHDASHPWPASPQARFERLLRETSIAVGLLVSPEAIRLVYAPKGESSGHITFRIADMVQVAGRPILAALHMLLSPERLFTASEGQRLPALLKASRRYQNTVSTKLSGQVTEALFELLRGFQSAHDQTGILDEVLGRNPNQVYAGLLTVLLRLVFVLYAEDRDLLSSGELWINNYSVGGLHERLTADRAQYPDTMDQRYGSWAQLLVLFRIVFEGACSGSLQIPARRGYLFDPERYPFLEARLHGQPSRQAGSPLVLPRVSDGTIQRVLSLLLVLDGERLSYRNLDVEQIGSVYETMMGFELHLAEGQSIALKPKKRHGAPITINLERLLTEPAAKRNDWLNKAADQKLTGKPEQALKEARTVAALLAALDKRIARNVTPEPVRAGAMIFQPSPERRRSGSHYTPRTLTAPIVEHALKPVLDGLKAANAGQQPRSWQVLALKVCDPAMGSGAFLVEACRQLGDVLVEAWHFYGDTPSIPPDEDEILHARRLVAQRCLYGVDRNEMAVDLAKLSLWLATLAREHEFTFLDHSLRHGDALVGFSARQIAAFRFILKPNETTTFLEGRLRRDLTFAVDGRRDLLSESDATPYLTRVQKLAVVDDRLSIYRNLGDVLVSAFFAGKNSKARETARLAIAGSDVALAFSIGGKDDVLAGDRLSDIGRAMRREERPLIPFHWQLEFPEVFNLDPTLKPQGGFDCIVGNPPFAGKNTIADANPDRYIEWLKDLHPESHGNADLVAHFFRRAFTFLRPGGCFGLIATNTIAQGDTRSSGLRYIAMNGGTIIRATKRYKWPGEAAVVVSVVHVVNGEVPAPYTLDDRAVDLITAFLFHAGGNEDAIRLEENADKSFQGSVILGLGFTFNDSKVTGTSSSFADMHDLISKDPRNAERIFPYIGGEETNNTPTHAHHRYVINFEDFPLRRKDSGVSWFDLREDTRKSQLREGIVAPDYPHPVANDWPDLLAIIREKVKPERDEDNREALRLRWWQYAEKRPGLTHAKKRVKTVFATSQTSTIRLFCSLDSKYIFDQRLIVFPVEGLPFFAILSSRPHTDWSEFLGSSMKDDPVYTPSDCFETFPFPPDYEANPTLEVAGQAYYNHRAALMIANNEGLTKTYNRFHSPNDQTPGIVRLRELHDAMDRAVLDAYGWQDLQPVPAFFPEFDEDEEGDDPEPGTRPSKPRKKKHRLRWPDDMHDEVLARLLKLNRERAATQTPSSGKRRSTTEFDDE